jgi:mannosyltransferase
MHLVFLVGSGTVALRLPSAVAMTVAVALTGVLGRALSGSNRVAFFAGLSMTTIPFVDSYAQAGRSYAIDTAAVLVTCWLLLHALRTPDAVGNPSRRWLAYAAALTISGYLHEMTALVVLSHLVTLLWARVGRVQLRRWGVAVGCALLALGPLVLASAQQQSQLSWVHPTTFATAFELLASYLGPSRITMAINLALIVIGLAAGLAVDRGRRGVTLVRFALPLLVLPPATAITESAITHPLYGGGRYFLYCVPGAALLVGAGAQQVTRRLDDRRPRTVGRPAAWLAGTALMAALLVLQWPLQQHQRTARGQVQDMLALSAFIQGHARPGDGILYEPRVYAEAPLAFPGYFRTVHDVALAESPQRSGTLYGTTKSAAATRDAILAERRVWLVGPSAARPRPPDVRLLGQEFRAALRHRVKGAVITLYVRAPVEGYTRL